MKRYFFFVLVGLSILYDYCLFSRLKDKSSSIIQLKESYVFAGYDLKIEDVVELTEEDAHVYLIYNKHELQIGDHSIGVIACNQDNYCRHYDTTLHIVEEDKEPPQLTGNRDRTILAGDTLDLNKNIVISDNIDPTPTYVIDETNLNSSIPGIYEIVYTTKDRFGNTRDYYHKVTVLDKYASLPYESDGKKVAYLTFDDGPSANTMDVLNILDAYQIKATFFVTGLHENYFDLIKVAYERGHQIGLHTYLHEYETIYKSTTSYFNDLKKIGALVESLIGYEPTIIRFPGGSSNQISKFIKPKIMSQLVKEVRDQGYQFYDWNSDIGDAVLEKNHLLYYDYFLDSIKKKDKVILLMHDGSGNQETVKILPKIIQYLKNNGYEFKTIDEETPTFHHTVAN